MARPAAEAPIDPRLVKMARDMARHMIRKLPHNVLREDLEQAALVGLVDGLRKHPDGAGPGWEWYLRTRMRGSMIDELRAQDWASRRNRRAIEGGAQIPARIVRFDDLFDGNGQPTQIAAEGASPEEEADRSLLAARAWATPLPERERAILRLRYHGDRRQKAVADELGVSEARICQLEARALERMRGHVGAP